MCGLCATSPVKLCWACQERRELAEEIYSCPLSHPELSCQRCAQSLHGALGFRLVFSPPLLQVSPCAHQGSGRGTPTWKPASCQCSHSCCHCGRFRDPADRRAGRLPAPPARFEACPLPTAVVQRCRGSPPHPAIPGGRAPAAHPGPALCMDFSSGVCPCPVGGGCPHAPAGKSPYLIPPYLRHDLIHIIPSPAIPIPLLWLHLGLSIIIPLPITPSPFRCTVTRTVPPAGPSLRSLQCSSRLLRQASSASFTAVHLGGAGRHWRGSSSRMARSSWRCRGSSKSSSSSSPSRGLLPRGCPWPRC